MQLSAQEELDITKIFYILIGLWGLPWPSFLFSSEYYNYYNYYTTTFTTLKNFLNYFKSSILIQSKPKKYLVLFWTSNV